MHTKLTGEYEEYTEAYAKLAQDQALLTAIGEMIKKTSVEESDQKKVMEVVMSNLMYCACAMGDIERAIREIEPIDWIDGK